MQTERRIETTLPLEILLKPAKSDDDDWMPYDEGPGIFTIPEDQVAMVVIQNIHDDTVKTLVEEIKDCKAVLELNLSENRNVGNKAMRWIKDLHNISRLNLSACGLNDRGLDPILSMSNLVHLDLSYCTRLTDAGIKKLDKMRNLEEIYLRGIPRMSHAGLKRLERRGLVLRK